MPKQKSKRSLNKRIKVTKSGKIKRSHAKRSHLFDNKTQKQKRHLRKSTTMSKGDANRYKDVI